MKKDVVDYISRCMECQRVKAEHRHPTGLLQPLPIPKKKWEVVTIDFITKFPWTTRKHDSVMVVLDKLTKVAHFVHVKMTDTTTSIVEIYMREIYRLHGIPKAIVSDKYTKFTSNLWRGLFKGFGTNMNFSTTYHPQSDGQIERVNQVIEDMMRMYVMDKQSKWEEYFHLV
jgi:transposase InsO family protein